MDSDTRGSRCRFCTFRHAPMWAETIWSPSIPTQTDDTWGLPSGLRVTMWANRPAVTTSRTSAVIVAPIVVPHLHVRAGGGPRARRSAQAGDRQVVVNDRRRLEERSDMSPPLDECLGLAEPDGVILQGLPFDEQEVVVGGFDAPVYGEGPVSYTH